MGGLLAYLGLCSLESYLQDLDRIMAKVTRAETTRLNNEAILDALCALIRENGWDELSVSGVAKKAGVSVGAIYARAENLSELANTLWQVRLREQIVEVLELITEAVSASDVEQMLKVSSFMDKQIDILTPALELVVASQFDDELAEVIGEDFTHLISALTVPHSSSNADRHLAASQYLVMSFLFGRLLAMRNGVEIAPLTQEEATIISSFSKMKPEKSRHQFRLWNFSKKVNLEQTRGQSPFSRSSQNGAIDERLFPEWLVRQTKLLEHSFRATHLRQI